MESFTTSKCWWLCNSRVVVQFEYGPHGSASSRAEPFFRRNEGPPRALWPHSDCTAANTLPMIQQRLFRAQSLHGFDRSGAAGRDESCRSRAQPEHQGRTHQRNRIVASDFIQLAGHIVPG